MEPTSVLIADIEYYGLKKTLTSFGSVGIVGNNLTKRKECRRVEIHDIEAKLRLDAEEALDTTNELVSLMDDISPQVVIRGAKGCTFNIYPTTTKIYYGKDDEPTDGD